MSCFEYHSVITYNTKLNNICLCFEHLVYNMIINIIIAERPVAIAAVYYYTQSIYYFVNL